MDIREWVQQAFGQTLEEFKVDWDEHLRTVEEKRQLCLRRRTQVGFTKPMMEESVIDRIARLEVEGHGS